MNSQSFMGAGRIIPVDRGGVKLRHSTKPIFYYPVDGVTASVYRNR